MSQNPKLKSLSTGGNPKLNCIKISEEQLDKINSGELPGWEVGNTDLLLECN